MTDNEIVEEDSGREYGKALGIKEYLHSEEYDKAVMASMIASAKVMGRTGWKSHGNIRMFMKRFWVKCKDNMV